VMREDENNRPKVFISSVDIIRKHRS
jgi:hypothetical protein